MSKAADRTAKDYAIEFGGYLATAAERYIEAVTGYAIAIKNEGSGKPFDDEAVMSLNEQYRALTSAIYEFRKRAEKAKRIA